MDLQHELEVWHERVSLLLWRRTGIVGLVELPL